jgi:glycosyltransferase involved in cell wall biosynthesis
MKKKALVLVFSNLKHDARVSRQVQWLSAIIDTTLVCFDADEISGTRVIRIKQTPLTPVRKAWLATLLLFRQFNRAYNVFHDYSFLKKQFRDEHFDLIVANDIDTLPLAFSLSAKSKIIFDAHEYAPRHFENNKVWTFFFQAFNIHLCKTFIPRVDAMLTVGKGLANEYEKEFGIKPVVITNATSYHNLEPSSVSSDKIKLIHHGIVNKSRRLELMIEMMRYLDSRFTLDMILMTSDYASSQTKAYIHQLKQTASEDPRIKILPGVKSHQVVSTIHSYDIGVFIIPPVNFNYANTLPNKLFDFIQARIGVAIGPTPEMADIVTQYQIGVVAESFDPKVLAMKLNSLTTQDISTFKTNSKAAAMNLNAEKNQAIFSDLVTKILNS